MHGTFVIDRKGRVVWANRWVGPFGVNAKLTFASETDEMKNTVGFAEVKPWQPALRNSGVPNRPNVPQPSTPGEAATYGGGFATDWSHGAWVNGEVLQTGCTTAFPPNTVVPYTTSGVTYASISPRSGSASRLLSRRTWL